MSKPMIHLFVTNFHVVKPGLIKQFFAGVNGALVVIAGANKFVHVVPCTVTSSLKEQQPNVLREQVAVQQEGPRENRQIKYWFFTNTENVYYW